MLQLTTYILVNYRHYNLIEFVGSDPIVICDLFLFSIPIPIQFERAFCSIFNTNPTGRHRITCLNNIQWLGTAHKSVPNIYCIQRSCRQSITLNEPCVFLCTPTKYKSTSFGYVYLNALLLLAPWGNTDCLRHNLPVAYNTYSYWLRIYSLVTWASR